MHSHVLTDSTRTGGTHLISTSCSARGSVYKCSVALIRYWLQIRKCPGVLTEINSEPLRHSDPLQRCLFSHHFTKRLGKASHLSQLSLYTPESHGNASQKALFHYAITVRCYSHTFWSGKKKEGKFRYSGNIARSLWGFFWQELKLALGLLFVNGYCNVGFSITDIAEDCIMQIRPRANDGTNHHVVSLPPIAIYHDYYCASLMNHTQHPLAPSLDKH